MDVACRMLEFVCCKLYVGSRLLYVGCCKLAVGSWKLYVGCCMLYVVSSAFGVWAWVSDAVSLEFDVGCCNL